MHVRRIALFLTAFATQTGLVAQAPPTTAPVEAPFLGLQTELKDRKDPASGVVVTYVWPLSAAKEMGFQLGDEIKTLNDVLIALPEDFSREVRKENVNAKLRFKILRAGQEVKIVGRIGSRDKTMKAYQDQVRKDFSGKPLPPFPPVLWWNAAKKQWEENTDVINGTKGKITIYMSFDDCPDCKEKRYQRLSQMQTLLSKAPGGDQVAYIGIFYGERPTKSGKEANLKAATALVTSSPPTVPIAVAWYPDDRPTSQDRDTQVLLHNHGTAIVRSDGNVEFVQVVGVPEQEFGAAFQRILTEQQQKPSTEKPSDPKNPVEPKTSSP